MSDEFNEFCLFVVVVILFVCCCFYVVFVVVVVVLLLLLLFFANTGELGVVGRLIDITEECECKFDLFYHMTQPDSVAQLDARPTGDQEVAGSTPPPLPPARQHSFVKIDHEMFSMAFYSLPLIQEG